MGDSSFPARLLGDVPRGGEATDPNALIIGELWQKDSTLLRCLAGAGADTTMNYRAARRAPRAPRAAPVRREGDRRLGPRSLAPSEFLVASRLTSRRTTRRPPTTSLMNLIDSLRHDARPLDFVGRRRDDPPRRSRPPPPPDGKRRLRLASLRAVHPARHADRVLRRRGWRHGQRRPGQPAHLSVAAGRRQARRGARSPLRRTRAVADGCTGSATAISCHCTRTTRRARRLRRKTGSQAAIVAIDKGDASKTSPLPTAASSPTARRSGRSTASATRSAVRSPLPAAPCR